MTAKTASPAPVYAICGPEDFLKREALVRIIREVLEDDAESLGPSKHEGDRADLADVLDEVRTLSLLGDTRLVIVEDADGFISKHRAALERYCASPADTGCLVLLCKQFDARTRLYKAVNGWGGVIKCAALRGQAVSSWIADRARRVYGKRADAAAVSALRQTVGDALGLLDQELEKLATYVGQRPAITPGDIELLVGDSRERKVFAITDAMAEGNVAAALHQWEEVLATDRAAPGRAIGGLAWGIRRLLEAQDAVAHGTPVHELARQFWTQPHILKQRLERTPRWRLEDQLCGLLEADVAGKTGLSEVHRAVERFIVKHTACVEHTQGGGVR